jgi:glycine dehydrogenase subunit 2
LAEAFNAVAGEDDETLDAAPSETAARRIDQVAAARTPRLSWQALDGE